jgi:predicted MFS family arabinose efflux permease
MAGAGDVASELGLSTIALTISLFAGPIAIGALVEGAILLAADRRPRRQALAGSLALMALTGVASALAPGGLSLGVAFTIWGIATGISASIAEGVVVETDDAGRALTRWAVSATLGDLAAPLVLGLFGLVGGSWRAATLFGAALAAANALAFATGPDIPRPEEVEDDSAPGTLAAARIALFDPLLLAWTTAAAACTLLDEIFVVLTSLYLHEAGVGPAGTALELVALQLGALGGLALTERIVEETGRAPVLVTAAVAVGLALPAWLAVPGSALGVLALAVVGAGVAPMYPLSQASAFERLPGRPEVVAAVQRLLSPADVLLPVGVGIAADRLGTGPALLLLLAQPAWVAAISLLSARDRHAR